MEVGFWSEEAPRLLRRSEGDPSPAPGMDHSLSFNESLYILQENFFVTGDERKKSFGKCRITIHVLHIENMKSEISL